MIKELWIFYYETPRESVATHFEHDIKNDNQASIEWARLKKMKDDKALKEVEGKMDPLCSSEGFGF